MKKTLLVIALISILKQIAAQPLPPIVITYAPPCMGYVGLVDQIVVFPVPGATAYHWYVNGAGASCILFDGQPSPYQSSSNTVTIEFPCLVPSIQVGIYATNACCVSDTAFHTIIGIPNIIFNPNNDSIVAPNSSGIYSILNYICLLEANWSITGDADINGINDTVWVVGPGLHSVTLNFGPTFTTGILCVYGMTSINAITDTICMTITTPTGIEEHNQQNQITIYPNPAKDLLFINDYLLLKKENEIKVYDMEGRKVLQSIISERSPSDNQQSKIINIQSLQTGIYFIEINGMRKKFVKQ